MQRIPSSRFVRPSRGPVVIGTLVGGVLLAGGLSLAWLALTTPMVGGLSPAVVRPTPEQMILGAAVWGIALVAPPSFAIVGFFRLAKVFQAITAKPHVRAVIKAAAALGDEYSAASDVRLPDGRTIRDLVVGPFGLAVITELPSPHATRRKGNSWEVRRRDGRWAPVENPLERTARDAERVRRWTASEERDFVVKVFAAVVTTDATLDRSAGCAVIAPDQVAAWLGALPPARSLNADRYRGLIELVRSIA